MTTDYLAWNGQRYPWPPPNGWYEASDGRWWAPGSGPNPPPPPDEDPRRATAGVEPAAAARQMVAASTDHGPAQPAPSMTATHGQGEVLLAEQTGSAHPPPALEHMTEAHSGDAGIRRPPNDGRYGGSSNPVLIGLTVVGAVMLAVIGFLALRGDDSPITTATPITPSTVATPRTTIAPPQTTSTVPESTTTTIADAKKVEQFRLILDGYDLSSAQLTEADVIEFGAAFCAFAAVADDGAGFEPFRQQAIAGSTGELTPEELSMAIDAAVLSFCPREAERLGIFR